MGDVREGSIRKNFEYVRDRIERAAARAGRNPTEITLVGVSKTFPVEAIREAYEAGVRHFGENRVQEWEGKHGALHDLNATWHLVGHLQSNKAAKATRLFHTVDSLDGSPIAERLERAVTGEARESRKLRVLLEVRLAKEETKSGIEEKELPGLAEKVAALAHLDLAGLMCLPPFFENGERVRPFFARLRALRDDLEKPLGRKLPVLSMGMSQDFEVAIEEGATEIRVGTALFGSRRMK